MLSPLQPVLERCSSTPVCSPLPPQPGRSSSTRFFARGLPVITPLSALSGALYRRSDRECVSATASLCTLARSLPIGLVGPSRDLKTMGLRCSGSLARVVGALSERRGLCIAFRSDCDDANDRLAQSSGFAAAVAYIGPGLDRKSTRLNSSHSGEARMPSSA